MRKTVSNKTDEIEILDAKKVDEVVSLLCDLIQPDLGVTLNLNGIEDRTHSIFKILKQKTAQYIIEKQDPLEQTCSHCGKPMKIKERLGRKVKGWVDYTLHRRSFYCEACGTYERPLDALIGCAAGYTHQAEEAVLLLGQRLPFKEAEIFLKALKGISVSHETIQEMTEAVGRNIAREEALRVEAVIDSTTHQLKTNLPPQEKGFIKDTAYLMMDGSMVPTRDKGWKEVRVAVLFRENDRAKTDKHHTQLLRKKYFGTFNSDEDALQAFKDRATQEAYDFGFRWYEHHVIIGDGAPYIWDYATKVHPTAKQILDYYHAGEYIAKAVKSLDIADKSLHVRLLKRMNCKLRAGHIERIIAWLEKQIQTKEVQDCIRYYGKNKDRMRYRAYRRMGLCIGSGAIESAHRTVIQTRMKLSGMHWGSENVQSMVSLRAKVLSGQGDDIVSKFGRAA